jgi:mannose-6-phosphate isomerase-like protein (cupin superfamily)
VKEGESVSLGRFGTATLLEAAANPSVDPVRFEFALAPGGAGPPPHFHPHQEESWEVLEGVMELRLGAEKIRLAAGESAVAPPGTAHTFRNAGEQPLRFKDAHLPARGFQHYIEQLAELLGEGGERDPRTLLRLARLVASLGEDQRPDGPLSTIAVRAGGTVARLLRL